MEGHRRLPTIDALVAGKGVPAKMPIVPIIGQVLKVKATDIARYQHIIDLHRLTQLHFYTFEEGISQDRLDEMRFSENIPMALVDAIQPTHPSPPSNSHGQIQHSRPYGPFLASPRPLDHQLKHSLALYTDLLP